ncbi:MAG: ATP-dependent Clp protease ATP-binding subunit, partial [Aquiluna sp.]|nr:ATP-dependent Clp protease ATP-binding subunit [Aquiluna sp.]
MLARGELQTIGATTLDEYRKHFEKDAALVRRFQSVQVAEPNPAMAINILKGLRDRYEAHHKVSITDGAIVAAVSMSDRYVTDRFLPDKAIDLIDEAGARMRLSFLSAPPELKEMEEKIAVVKAAKEQAIADQDFEAAASKRDEEKKLTAEKIRMEKEFREGNVDKPGIVDEGLIAEVLAQATGIPVFKLGEDEGAKLIFMEQELHRRVIGQEAAIAALSKTIRRQRAGLKDPKRPSGSFIFAGPTGVGKTELAKALAEFLFDDEDALIALDMSEYGEKHTVSRLFGAPPGFVGYDEGGQLTEKVRRKPFSVVLFDEIEKAHPDIFNSMLQILEEGRLTDGQGRVVDFKNTIIIMTTNLGTREITRGALGFTLEGNADNDYDQMRSRVNEELKKNFRPEFLNRVDEVIVFPQLNRAELLEIVDLFIKRLQTRLDDRDLNLTLTTSAKEKLIELGYDPSLGARPLRRVVQREIEDEISERILTGTISGAQDILVDFLDGAFTFVANSREEEPVS